MVAGEGAQVPSTRGPSTGGVVVELEEGVMGGGPTTLEELVGGTTIIGALLLDDAGSGGKTVALE